VLIAGYLREHGLLEALKQQVRLVRGRFGCYEVIDFVAVLMGYALSGERTLQAYYDRLAAFALPFMALFERRDLPHRATLSRFLSAVDTSCLEALRALFASSRTVGWTPESIGGLWDRQGQRYVVVDVDPTREAARQRALPVSARLPAGKRRLDAVCARGYMGRQRGEVVRTRTTVLQMHSRQWLGTYGGKGNGDYRGELSAALRAITTYLAAFDLAPTAGIVRLDGQYGDAAVIAQILATGLQIIVRGRGYTLLDEPPVQAVLAQAPVATITSLESGATYELFDLLDVLIHPDAPRCRLLIIRHPWSGKPVTVGTRVGEWVYELFVTTLPPEGFLATDLLDLYHGRGAFEGTLADEDTEGDPDRWCSHAPHGQELWQIVWQWIWNLRLLLGQALYDRPLLRAADWSPPDAAALGPPPLTVSQALPAEQRAWPDAPRAPQEYGPLQWASRRGRATGRLGGAAFTLEEDGRLRCPAGAFLALVETRQETPDRQRLIYQARVQDCAACSLRTACLGSSARAGLARRVSARRRRAEAPVFSAVTAAAPPPAPAMRSQAIRWSDLPARALRRTWMTYWRSQAVQITLLPDIPRPLARAPRASRAHYRLGWEERLSRNARASFLVAHLHVAGVPTALAHFLGGSGTA
jgi:hypothetical protein